MFQLFPKSLCSNHKSVVLFIQVMAQQRVAVFGFADAFPSTEHIIDVDPTSLDTVSLLPSYSARPSSSAHRVYNLQIEQQQPPQQLHSNCTQNRRFAPRLFLAFCTGGPESYGTGFRALLNRFVAWRSGGMWHVEAVFQWHDGSLTGWHCTLEGPIQLLHRDGISSYNTSRWTNFSVLFNDDERWRMFDFFCAQNEKPYNKRGLMCNFLPIINWICGTSEKGIEGKSWFCSELIMAALKHTRPQEFSVYRASCTNINDLHSIMQHHRCFSPAITTMVDTNRHPLRLTSHN